MYVYDGSTWKHMAEVGGAVTAHDIGGSSHNADTLANINTKCSDDELVGKDTTQTLTNKTLTTPTIGDFTNAGHDHADAAGGSQIAHANLSGMTATDHHDNSNDPTSDEKDALAGTGTPSSSNKFVTEDTLAAMAQGLDPKASVRVIVDSDWDGSGLPTFDGVALADGDRVLLVAQTDASENGIWIAHTAATITRPADFATGDEAAGAYVFAREGDDYADTGWVCTTNAPSDVIDTDDLAFEQFTGAGQITAGTSLTKDGNTIQIGNGTVEARGGIDFTADDIAVKPDDTTLEINGSGEVQVKDDGIDKTKLNSDVAGNGIAQAAGGELNVDPADSTVVSGHTASSEGGVSVISGGVFSAIKYAGNPNGVVTAPFGMLCRDTTGGITYINTDGSTAWSVV